MDYFFIISFILLGLKMAWKTYMVPAAQGLFVENKYNNPMIKQI